MKQDLNHGDNVINDIMNIIFSSPRNEKQTKILSYWL